MNDEWTYYKTIGLNAAEHDDERSSMWLISLTHSLISNFIESRKSSRRPTTFDTENKHMFNVD